MAQQPQQQQQGSVILWALWVLFGVTAALLLVSKALEAVTARGFLGGARPAIVTTREPPAVGAAPPATTEPAPVVKTVPTKAPVTPPPSAGVESITARVEGRVRVHEIVWRAPAGAALRFDARRFYVIGFARSGARCAVAAPAASAWSRSADRTADNRRIAERRLLSRGDSEKLEAQALARRLGISDATIEECTAVAARIDAPSGATTAHKVRCGDAAFEAMAEADWTQLVSAHNRGRNAGVAILAKGLSTPPAALAAMRAGVKGDDHCTADASARARLLAAIPTP